MRALDAVNDLLKRFVQCWIGLAGAAAAQKTPHGLEIVNSDAGDMVTRMGCSAHAQDQQMHGHLSEFHEFDHCSSHLALMADIQVGTKFKQLMPACQRRRLH